MQEDILLKQALKEYDLAVRYRSPRVQTSWYKNEDLYFQRKKKEIQGRHNILLGEMQGFVDTLVSKVDDPPQIQFLPCKEADTRKAEKVSKAWEIDSGATKGDWGFKDLLGKKQASLYGRAVYKYYAESDPEYRSVLDLVDVYDFLIDPLAGGEDVEKAKYLGHDNIFRSIYDLEGDKRYGQKQLTIIKLGIGRDKQQDIDNQNKEKQNRASIFGFTPDKYQSEAMLKLVEWYTTYEGKRYLVVFDRISRNWLRVEQLKDVFETKEYANGDPLWPIDSWATNPDMFEFWTPSPADQVREIIQAKSLLISQAFDNRQYNNFGMKAYDVKMFPNPALLEPRWAGLVPVNPSLVGKSIQDGIYEFRYPSLGDTSTLYDILEAEKGKNSGITPGTQGLAESDKKVGVMENELAQSADRMGLFNKSYARFWVKMGKRYLNGLKEHLGEKMAIKMMGQTGIEWDHLVKEDLNTDFDINIIGLNAELINDARAKKQKIDILLGERNNPVINPKTLEEKILEIAGLEKEEIQDLFDVQNEYNKQVILQAAEESEKLVKEDVTPNRDADTGHVRKHLDYLKNNHVEADVYARFMGHVTQEVDIARKNMVEKMFMAKAKMGVATPAQLPNEQTPELAPSIMGESQPNLPNTPNV